MGTVTALPETEQAPALENRALSIVNEARALVIVDQDTLNAAGAFVTERIRPLLAEADAVFDPVILSAHRSHKEALNAKAKVSGPLVQAEGILKASIGGFIRQQEQIRQEEERRLRREEELRQEQIREAEIEAAEKAGADAGLVEAICEEPLPPPAPVVVPRFQKPAGISTRETWAAQVTNLKELCRAIAEGDLPEVYVAPNMTALNARARAEKGLMQIPGVRAVSDTGVSARRF